MVGAPLVQGTTGRLQPGGVLQSRYVIQAKIGQGGMGAVYRVMDQRIPGKEWAIKEIDLSRVRSQDVAQAKAAFQKEARLLSSLNHPGLPRVVDYFDEGGNEYLVMDFIHGRTLEDELQLRGGRVDEATVLNWVDQICNVLDYLHHQHPPIIFRDLKPGNIMLTPQNQIKLIDFGIARHFDPHKARDTVPMGTPGYAPREQYGKGQTDARSDVYSLGATLHQLLTGHDPGTTPFALPPARSLNHSVSPHVDQALQKALQLAPQDRFQSVAAMQQAIRQPAYTPPPPVPPRVTPPVHPSSFRSAASSTLWSRAPRVAWVIGGILLLGLLAWAGLAIIIPDGNDTPTPTQVAQATDLPTFTGSATADTTPSSSMPGPTKTPTQSTPTLTKTATPSHHTPTATPTPTPSGTPTPTPAPKIAFSASQRGRSNVDIYIMDPDGSRVSQLTFGVGSNSGPDWSPDGRYIAFHSNRQGNYDVYVIDRNGESLSRLTDHAANDYDPSWSPDGTQIVFMSERSGNREIYVMNADGSNVQRLTNTASGPGAPKSERQPAWSPRGDNIAFESRRTGKAHIYLMDPNGKNQRPLTNSAGVNFSPKWSPDGLWIVFASTRDGSNKDNKWPEIYIASLSGSRQSRLTFNSADDEAPAWSPDGQWIVFASKRDSCPGRRDDGDCDWDLYLTKSDGSGIRRLTHTSDLSEYNPVWWSP